MLIDIVLVCAEGRGGLENVISMISKELIRRGNLVRVIQVFKPKFKEWQQGLDEFYTLSDMEFNKSISIESMSEKYAQFMNENGIPDAVLATHVPASTYLWYKSLELINKTDDVPLISWIHGPLPAYGENYDELMKYADAHLAISGEIENQLIGLSNKASVYLIHNPVKKLFGHISRGERRLEILYVGRLEKEKRVSELLDLCTELEDDWHLTIIGDGSEKNIIESKIEKYNLYEKVEMLGWKSNPWNSIDNADLLILPSEQEGFGLVMVEALSCGIPVLATRTEGAVDIIEDEYNGWLVDVDDYSEIKDILIDIQSEDLELPSKEVCMSSVLRYNIENVVDKLENALKIEINKKLVLNKKNKVIDIVVNYLCGRGGTEKILKMVIDYLDGCGYRVRLIQSYKVGYADWLCGSNVEVYTLFSERQVMGIDPEAFVEEYKKVIDRFGKPKIMMATGEPYISFLCSKVKRVLNVDVKIISWIHNPLYIFESYEDIRYADAHLAISKGIYEQIRSIDMNKKIYLVYNPVTVKDRAVIKTVDNEMKLIYIGRLENRQKNISMLFNVLSRISGKWSLDMYGDGEDYRWLRGLAETIDINDNIIWNKWVEDPWEKIDKASALVLPSKFEGFGLVIVEALKRGVPVITTRCGIAEEVIKDGNNGWLIENENMLCELLQNIIDKKVILPSREECKDSIKWIDKQGALKKIKESIEEYIDC